MRTRDYSRIKHALAILILPYFVVTLPAGAQNYTFTQIPPDSNFSTYSDVAPVINNNGTIAFSGRRLTDEVSGIWTWSSSQGCKLIAETELPYPHWEYLSINDAGVVAFYAILPGRGEGIFTGDGSSITTIAEYNDIFGTLSAPSINNAGTVVFTARRTSSLYSASGGKLKTIPCWPNSWWNGGPVINDGGTISCPFGTMGCGFPCGIGTTAVRIIVYMPSNHLWPTGSHAMNNAGAVVFVADDGLWNYGLYIGCGNLDANGVPLVDVVVEPHGPYGCFGDVATNDVGIIAFKADHNSNAVGIFTGPDPVTDKVVATGDTILGEVVSMYISFSREGLNDSGQIVFNDYGRIILANPDYSVQPGGPILPVNSEPPWLLIFDIPCDVPTYTCPPPVVIDPEVAIGYDYQVIAGPNFSGVTLPDNIGDDLFWLYLWDGDGYVFERALAGSQQFFFEPGGVDRFRILGIEASANVDAGDPLAFPTHVCFTACGHVEMTMTPLTTQPCMVDFERFAKFADYWRATGGNLPADLKPDDKVDFADLARFVERWLDCCPVGWQLN
jgi:hypothetical protein